MLGCGGYGQGPVLLVVRSDVTSSLWQPGLDHTGLKVARAPVLLFAKFLVLLVVATGS